MSKFLPHFPVLMHWPEKSVAIEEEKRGCLKGSFPLDFDFDWILCNTSYEATQRVVSAQVDEIIRWLLLLLGGWLLLA